MEIPLQSTHSTAPTSPHLPTLNFEARIPRAAQTPRLVRSFSVRNKSSPHLPTASTQPVSPRKRAAYANSVEKFKKTDENINISQEKLNLIIGSLAKEENGRDFIFSKSSNCCIFPEHFNNKSSFEQKFMRREYPSFFSSDQQFYQFLFQQFQSAFDGISQRYSNCTKQNQTDKFGFLTAQLDLWFTLFDECIYQQSSKSRVTAFILHNIYEILKNSFAYLLTEVKSNQKFKDPDGFYRNKSEEESLLPPLHAKIKSLQAEIERQKREYKKLEEETKRFHVENYELKQEIQSHKDNVNNLLKTSDTLISRISVNERRIFEMSQKRDIIPMDPTLGAVPDDVLQIWDQSSQFLRDILDNSLTNIDLDNLMPEYMSTPQINAYVTLPRPEDFPRDEKRIFHFTQLYKSIKFCSGDNNSESFFNTLEQKVREMYQKFGSFYYNRIVWARKNQIEHIAKLNNYNSNLRKFIPDLTDVVRIIIESTDLFNYPKKPVDIRPQITNILSQVPNLMKQAMKPRSAAEIVTRCLKGNDLVLFLLSISKQCHTDIYIDLIRKFIVKDLPFNMFIFFSKIALQSEEVDFLKRPGLIASTFSHLGYEQIPIKTRKAFETTYCSSLINFEIFMLSLYQTAIENIAIQLAPQIDTKNVEETISVYFKCDEILALDLYQYMVALSESLDPTVLEFAIVAFDRKNKFENVFTTFSPEKSSLIDYMNNFGKVDPKERPRSKRSTKSNCKTRASSVKSSQRGSPNKFARLSLSKAISSQIVCSIDSEDENGYMLQTIIGDDQLLPLSEDEEVLQLNETGIEDDGLENLRIDANAEIGNHENVQKDEP